MWHCESINADGRSDAGDGSTTGGCQISGIRGRQGNDGAGREWTTRSPSDETRSGSGIYECIPAAAATARRPIDGYAAPCNSAAANANGSGTETTAGRRSC